MPFFAFPHSFSCCDRSYIFSNVTEIKTCILCNKVFNVIQLSPSEFAASGTTYAVVEKSREPPGYPTCPWAPRKLHPGARGQRPAPPAYRAERCLSGSFRATTVEDDLAQSFAATGLSPGLKWACACDRTHEAHIPICPQCGMQKPQ